MAKNNIIYQKRGNLNFKERKMISDINAVLAKKPELEQTLIPASNFDELKDLHTKFIADDVDFVDIKPNPRTSQKAPVIDPLNRDEPAVRDYVMDDKFDPFADFQKESQSTYKEPTNFAQAFDLPDEDELKNNPQPIGNTQQRPNKTETQRPQLVSSGEDTGKDKRRSKRFAKSIVTTVCNLLEVGFVWYATKDINENKLAEYEMSGEIDVYALLAMPDGSEATIKEFFLSQLGDIAEASKITQEKRDDLSDSLTELFIDKNIHPTPAFEFGMNLVSVLAEQSIKLYMISNQNTLIINQLREKNALLREANQYHEPQQEYTPPPTPTPPPPRKRKSVPNKSPKLSPATSDEVDDIMTNELSLLETTETKE